MPCLLEKILNCPVPELRVLLRKEFGLRILDLEKESWKLRRIAQDLNADQQYDYGEWCRLLSGNTGSRGGHFVPNGFGCFSLVNLSGEHQARALLLNRKYQPRGLRYSRRNEKIDSPVVVITSAPARHP